MMKLCDGNGGKVEKEPWRKAKVSGMKQDQDEGGVYGDFISCFLMNPPFNSRCIYSLLFRKMQVHVTWWFCLKVDSSLPFREYALIREYYNRTRKKSFLL